MEQTKGRETELPEVATIHPLNTPGQVQENMIEKKENTYLALNSSGLIITFSGGSHAATNSDSTITSLDTTSLGQVLITLLLSDLNLLLFTTAAEFIGAELVAGLELSPAVFGDITFRHDGR